MKRKRALQRCNLPRDNLVRGSFEPMWQRAEKVGYLSRCLFSSQLTGDIGRIAPYALKIFFCFLLPKQGLTIHPETAVARDTVLCLHKGVSYPSALI